MAAIFVLSFVVMTACDHPTKDVSKVLAQYPSNFLSKIELLNDETLTGSVLVRIHDDLSVSKNYYFLITDDHRKVRLGIPENLFLNAGDRIEVSGKFTFSGGQELFRVSSTKFRHKVSLYRRDRPLVRTPMHHRVAVLAMGEVSLSNHYIQRQVNGEFDSLQDFYRETSHGIDTFSGEVFKRYNISYTENNCTFDNSDSLADLLIEAFENDGYHPSDYEHITVIIPKKCGAWGGAWANIGEILADGTLKFQSLSMYKENVFDPWYLAHEMGHNLGMSHAKSIDCGTRFYRPRTRDCSYYEYGNDNDVMGWGEGIYFGTPHQRFMGWIDESYITTAQGHQTYQLYPADGDSNGLKAVRVPIPGELSTYFYVEYRYPRTDSRYAGTGNKGPKNRKSAVLITRSRDGYGHTSDNQRIELGTAFYEGALPGQRYDLGRGLVVEILSLGDESARVYIETPDLGMESIEPNLRQSQAGYQNDHL